MARLGQSLFASKPSYYGSAFTTTIRTIDTHTGGEPLRIISEGLPELQGTTVNEKREYFMKHLDHVRRGIIQEPRGHVDMYGAVLTPAADDADLDVFFLNSQGYSPMCGHAVVAITKVVLETGAVPLPAGTPVSGAGASFDVPVLMNSPAGLVRAVAACSQDAAGKLHVKRTRFENVPCYVQHAALTLDVPGLGAVRATVTWGGVYYMVVDVAQLNDGAAAALEPSSRAALVAWAARLKAALLDSGADLAHPTNPAIGGLFGVIFVGTPQDSRNHSRNVAVFEDGCIDRCPTGTGVSGRAAALFADGKLELDQPITIESIVGSEMTVKVVRQVEWEGRAAVVPEVTADAHVMGESCFYLGEDDPLRAGVNFGI